MPLPPVRTAAFEAFTDPARQAPQLWRLGAGIIVATVVWVAAAAGLALVGKALVGPAGETPDPRLSLVLGLFGFGGLSAGVWLAARFLHRRRPVRLLGPGGVRWRQVAAGAAVVAVAAAFAAVPLVTLVGAHRQTPGVAWAFWLPVAIPAIIVQASAEELAFRGYLMQALAARFGTPLLWWVLPALLFGLLHWDPAGLGWMAVVAATVSGLVLADVTVRTGNLSAAIGLHVANNIIALLILAPPSALDRLSLFVQGDAPALRGGLLLIDVTTTLAAWGLWRLWGRVSRDRTAG